MPKPKEPSILEIVAEIETSIKYFPILDKENIRYEFSKIIKNGNFGGTTASKKKTIILKTLKEKGLFYLETDKSSSIFAVDVLDYHERMDSLITEGPYQEIMLNPLNKMVTAVKRTVENIKTKYF
jgi:hypothetical protein